MIIIVVLLALQASEPARYMSPPRYAPNGVQITADVQACTDAFDAMERLDARLPELDGRVVRLSGIIADIRQERARTASEDDDTAVLTLEAWRNASAVDAQNIRAGSNALLAIAGQFCPTAALEMVKDLPP